MEIRNRFTGKVIHSTQYENLNHENLQDKRLVDADFSNQELVGTKFARANLVGATFFRTMFFDVDFRGADLRGVRISDTTFTRCRGILHSSFLYYEALVWQYDGRIWMKYGCATHELDHWKKNLVALCMNHEPSNATRYINILTSWIAHAEAWVANEMDLFDV